MWPNDTILATQFVPSYIIALFAHMPFILFASKDFIFILTCIVTQSQNTTSVHFNEWCWSQTCESGKIIANLTWKLMQFLSDIFNTLLPSFAFALFTPQQRIHIVHLCDYFSITFKHFMSKIETDWIFLVFWSKYRLCVYENT